jgi:uncharacterized membrane protein
MNSSAGAKVGAEANAGSGANTEANKGMYVAPSSGSGRGGQNSATNDSGKSDKGGIGFFGWYFILLLIALLLIGIILAVIYFLCFRKAMNMAKGDKYEHFNESEDDEKYERKSKNLREIRNTESKKQENDFKRESASQRSRIGSTGSGKSSNKNKDGTRSKSSRGDNDKKKKSPSNKRPKSSDRR